jgi:hypothetical protein
MKEWLEHIAIPYKRETINQLKLPADQRGLLIFDCWSKHRTSWWIDECKKAGFEVVFVPANWTAILQPMDLSVNAAYKRALSQQFNYWLTDQILQQLKAKVPLHRISIDDSFPTLKKELLQWVIAAHNCIGSNTIIKGFEKAGILRAWETSLQVIALARKSELGTIQPVTTNTSKSEEVETESDEEDAREDEEELSVGTFLDLVQLARERKNLIRNLDVVEESNTYAKVYLTRCRKTRFQETGGQSLSAQLKAIVLDAERASK